MASKRAAAPRAASAGARARGSARQPAASAAPAARKVRRSSISSPLHVVRFARHPHRQRLEVIAQDDLAGEARIAGDPGGEVEQILLLLARRRKLGEIL